MASVTHCGNHLFREHPIALLRLLFNNGRSSAMAKPKEKPEEKPKKRPAVVEDATARRRRSDVTRGVPHGEDAKLETYEQPVPRDNDDPRTRENMPDSITPHERDARLND
jgi:hypothetical protein